jgi:hypothetical protein
MAKVRNNILIQGLTGSLGNQLVIRTGKGGQTIVSAKPVFAPNRKLSAAQQAHHAAFQEAAAYAKFARDADIYVAKAQGTTLNPYNVAVADWFNKPRILELDVTAWNGQAGQPIRVRATDDVQVTQVFVVISDGNGTVLEQGAAFPLDTFWWSYVTTAQANGNRRLLVTAQDRPGHKAQTTWQN